MEMEDCDIVRSWRFAPENYDFFYEWTPTSKFANDAWFKEALSRRTEINLIIERGGETVGTIALTSIDYRNRKCEMGRVFVQEDARKDGVGFESCALLLKYAFKHLNMHKVCLEVFADNAAAVTLYEKLGFVKVGTMKRHIYKAGVFKDVIVMEIIDE
jgi:diamine N-acetyltransferase